jgi:RNA polymerase-binding transcription factor DksA
MPAPKRPTKAAATPATKPKAAPPAVKKTAAKPVVSKAAPAKVTPKNNVAKATAKAAPAKPAAVAKATPAKAAPKVATPVRPAAKQAAAEKKAPATTKAAPTKQPAPAKKAAPSDKSASAAKESTTTPTAKATPTKAANSTPAKKSAAKAPAKNAKPAPADNKSAFDKKFIDEQREMLVEERAKYLRSSQLLKAEADSLMFEREPGDVQFDEESGEGDTLAVERDFDLALSAQARQQVDEIDAALARIEAGTYGLCRVSGLPIPKERLRAIPWATERVEYKVGGLGRR